jgi:AraC-like DNA-binding protein
MTKLHYNFSEIDSDRSFISLARALESNIHNNLITISPSAGEGRIRKLKLEDGLYMRAWDICTSRDTVFNKLPEINPREKQFHVAYFFNPELLLDEHPRLGKKWKAAGGVNMLFFSNDAEMHFQLKPGERLKAIDISITASWINNAFSTAGPLYTSYINQLQERPSPTVTFDAAAATEFHKMAELHAETLTNSENNFHVKAVVLSLLSCFFDRVVHRSATEVLRHNVFYYDKMLETKRIIVSHTLGVLPGIDSIARQVALSPSTLKRHFKLMFQKSIYEFYLDHKMELAMRMLMEKPLSVNEVAATMGYEKSSNFIEMFKKHFGVSPGSLRKKAG